MAFKLFPKDFTTNSKGERRRLLWIVLFILSLIILVILYLNFWRSPSLGVDIFFKPSVSVEGILQGIDFDDQFLKDNYFLDLRSYGEWPLEIGQKGRPNPFLP
ncbi:MAG: hypothetical protein ABH889_00450 [Candidatus Portnoybacteria bacterium]